ncbi:MAG: hypothetical protein ACXVNF_12180, partial [Neobacillus sp.]
DPMKKKMPLKIWNTCKGAGVVAAFNINEGTDAVHGSIGPSDVPNLAGETFVIFDVLTKSHWILNKEERIEIKLAENGVSLYLITPFQDSVTPIGLLNKLICNDGIETIWDMEKEMNVTLKEGGIFAFLSEREPLKATVNGELVLIQQDSLNPQLFTIDCNDAQGEVLVEIEKAH